MGEGVGMTREAVSEAAKAAGIEGHNFASGQYGVDGLLKTAAWRPDSARIAIASGCRYKCPQLRAGGAAEHRQNETSKQTG